MLSSTDNIVPKKQRALILGGGGALGAYEAGAIALCDNLMERDKNNGGHNGLLFDIIAGTSIGAMNGAVLVSQFLQTGSWKDAAKRLIDFWVDVDECQVSTVDPDKLLLLQPWLNDEE